MHPLSSISLFIFVPNLHNYIAKLNKIVNINKLATVSINVNAAFFIILLCRFVAYQIAAIQILK